MSDAGLIASPAGVSAPAGSAPLALEVAGLRFRRRPRAAGEPDFEARLDLLSAPPGALIALVGPSGCGKSTLLDMLGLILPPEAVDRFALAEGPGGGDLTALVRAGGLDALAPSRAQAVAYVLQQGGLLPFFTVRENICVGARLGAEDAARLTELAEELEIDGLLSRRPSELSVGQRQRVSLARALFQRPALLLADEPTAALDPPNAAAATDLLIAAARRRGTAVIMANHDWRLIAEKGFARLEARIETAPGLVRSSFAMEGA